MEFIIEKRKDLSFIGPEFSSILNGDDETKIHVCSSDFTNAQEIEFDYPNIHTFVSKDFEKVQNSNPGISRIRLRGADLFKHVYDLVTVLLYRFHQIPSNKHILK